MGHVNRSFIHDGENDLGTAIRSMRILSRSVFVPKKSEPLLPSADCRNQRLCAVVRHTHCVPSRHAKWTECLKVDLLLACTIVVPRKPDLILAPSHVDTAGRACGLGDTARTTVEPFIQSLSSPDEEASALLRALDLKYPTSLAQSRANVDTKKKLLNLE